MDLRVDIDESEPEWSLEDNKLFENAVVMYGLGTKLFYNSIVKLLPGKSIEDIRKKGMSLIKHVVPRTDHPMPNNISRNHEGTVRQVMGLVEPQTDEDDQEGPHVQKQGRESMLVSRTVIYNRILRHQDGRLSRLTRYREKYGHPLRRGIIVDEICPLETADHNTLELMNNMDNMTLSNVAPPTSDDNNISNEANLNGNAMDMEFDNFPSNPPAGCAMDLQRNL